jgi:calcium/calmodulin-dependent protein kinase I
MRSVQMLQTEIKMMQALNHPNICKFIEVYTQRKESNRPPECRIILEYLEGGSLHSLVRRRGYLSELECWYLLRQVLSALSYCHSKNVVHRDCKLENLLLTYKQVNGKLSEYPIVKLIDFGFAAIAETDCLTESCGTPEYIAPEVVRRQPYGKAVDMWSLGVVAFVLSSGRFPFRGADLTLLLKAIRKGEFTWSKKSNISYSESYKTFTSRLLDVSAKDRYTAESAFSHLYVMFDERSSKSNKASNSDDGSRSKNSLDSFDMSEISSILDACSNTGDINAQVSSNNSGS